MPADTNLEPSSDALERLRDEGFTHSFRLEHDAVVHEESHTRYRPEDVEIVSTHRNEGNTDPGDESVVFAVRTPDGTCGTLTTNYGADAPHADAIRRLGTEAK